MPPSAPYQPSRLERACAELGLRMTGQRRTIARVLSQSPDHPDVDELYRRANRIDSRISLSTVYRTLKLFEAKGILARHDFGAGPDPSAGRRHRYEEAPREHHDHLIDVENGGVIEFRNEEIERLQERVARELGFRLIGHRLELYGVPLKQPAGNGKADPSNKADPGKGPGKRDGGTKE